MTKTFGNITCEIDDSFKLSDIPHCSEYGEQSYYYGDEKYDVYLEDDRRVDCKLLIETNDYYGLTGDDTMKGTVEVNVLLVPLPEALDAGQRESVAHSCGVEPDELTIEDVCSYGCYVPMSSEVVKGVDDDAPLDADKVQDKVRTAYKCLDCIGSMAGFYLDRPMNAMGSSGWDFMESFVKGGTPW